MSKEYIIPFWKAGEANGHFCQWYLSDFTFNIHKLPKFYSIELDKLLVETGKNKYFDFKLIHNKIFNCTEKFMMVCKALLFDHSMIDRIMELKDPRDIKNSGRLIKNFNQYIWDKTNIILVSIGNYYKYKYNKFLKEKLLETKDAIIVEASPLDRIWGVGLGPNNKKIYDMNEWRGQNRLGIAIMMARDIINKPF
jgi:ribA/ribD-fused uncharacterized protein